MKRFFVLIITMASLLQISGCGFSLGSSASPPIDLQIAAGDSSITATWTMAPGVQYWLTTTNSTSNTEILVSQNVVSPYLVGPLLNGQGYSFVMDARVNNGPAGSKTAPISATPRNAGVKWNAGASISIGIDLRGIAYNPLAAANTITAVLAGANGAIYSSLDGMSWTPQSNPNPSPAANLNAVRYGGYYMAAGAAGTVLTSPDAITWTNQTTGTANELYAIATNGAGQYIATGASGTIIASSNGVNWVTATSGTTNSLNGATYGNGRYVAVGANNTLIASADGVNWTAIANTFGNLNSVAYGAWTVTATGALITTFVAVGDAGTIITSPDGLTWTKLTTNIPNKLTGIDFGRQFVAVGSNGGIWTSIDGATWLTQTSGTPNVLKAVTHSAYGYFAVGAAGTNLSSF